MNDPRPKALDVVLVEPPPVAQRVQRGAHFAKAGEKKDRYTLPERLESSAHFDELANILFEQALLAEGGQLDDPAAYVKRVNALLLA